MDHLNTWGTDTRIVRLRTLATQLAAQIIESQKARARLVRALEATAWPEVPRRLHTPALDPAQGGLYGLLQIPAAPPQYAPR